MICKAEGCSNLAGLTPSGRCNTGGYCRRCINCLNKYGIDSVKRDEILLRQENRCAICRIEISFKRPYKGDKSHDTACLDHCHSTSNIRGVLCASCNNGLGRFKDNVQLLEGAIRYLNNVSNKS